MEQSFEVGREEAIVIKTCVSIVVPVQVFGVFFNKPGHYTQVPTTWLHL